MNEITLENDDQIVINGVQCSGAFFKNMGQVIDKKLPLYFMPNESIDSHGVLFRLVGREDISDQKIADAILDTANRRGAELGESLAVFLEKVEWFEAHTPKEVILYVKIRKYILENVLHVLNLLSSLSDKLRSKQG